jgi:hypothetical protein
MTTYDHPAAPASPHERPPAYFLADGHTFVPTRIAQGPWGESISGNFVGGMLGHAIDSAAVDSGLQPARLTVDLLRPVAMAPLRLQTTVVREGRRLTLIDAEMTQSDTVVARASALYLRRGDQPPGDVWTPSVVMPPIPPEPDETLDVDLMIWAIGAEPESAGVSFDLSGWQHDGPKYAWLRDVKPLVVGVPLTPFVRAAMAGDVVSSLTHYGTTGLHFINADYTLTLSRLPQGEYIGLAAIAHCSHDGVATGTATMFDEHGPIGSATATALANPGFSPPKR